MDKKELKLAQNSKATVGFCGVFTVNIENFVMKYQSIIGIYYVETSVGFQCTCLEFAKITRWSLPYITSSGMTTTILAAVNAEAIIVVAHQ